MKSKIDTESRARAESTVTLGVSAFPTDLAEEWNKDCKEGFGDCRWIKMWHDHMKAKDYEFYKKILERVEALEEAVDAIINGKNTEKSEKTEDNIEVKTFTQTLKSKN